MCVSTSGEEEELPGHFIVDFQSFQDPQSGLLKAHAYPILRIEEAMGHQLINLRNPWGKPLLFKGLKWSWASPMWTA